MCSACRRGRDPGRMSVSAYKNTRVPAMKTQVQIRKILLKYGILDVRFTTLMSTGILVCEFVRKVKIDPKTFAEDLDTGEDGHLQIRIVISNINQKNENQMHRALYWYLKSKFESLTFGFLEFVQEFLPHLVLGEKTVYETIREQVGRSVLTGHSPRLLIPGGDQGRLE